ncbi:hypothetical protein [Sphingomicrobium sediminis]|uniref:DJ-1/PfpI domain-containing protein n=1 Tax=Sphingomicrobium sediminis TaxID=2950949 RepID=A0A9X2EF13_9SPHN|nr:hypothetical protein [Sphingomicrobium sediminis]MCM8556768.1 hypothetical protein [Sphingomicrobium sediminis]
METHHVATVLGSPEGGMIVPGDDPVARSLALPLLDLNGFDGLLLLGGEGALLAFEDYEAVHLLVGKFNASGRPVGLVGHSTCAVFHARDGEGRLLCEGRRWTGPLAEEDRLSEHSRGVDFQPYYIEERSEDFPDSHFVQGPAFEAHVEIDGDLVTAQHPIATAQVAHEIATIIARKSGFQPVAA